MTDIETILAALAAGAAAGGQEVVKTATSEAYASLRDRIRQILRRSGDETVLDTVEAEPGTWQYVVGAELARSGADRDAAVIVAARELLTAARDERFARVDLRDAKGVQLGDHNTQHNTF
jgi:hypothetical protein